MSFSDTGDSTLMWPSDTNGIRIQTLTRKSNYHRWVRDFKIIAQYKEVWELYIGELPILEAPDEEDFLGNANDLPTPWLETRAQAAKPERLASAHQNLQWRRLGRAEEKYEENANLVREANFLLLCSVDQTIRYSLGEHETPQAKWDWLKSQYRPSDTKTRLLAYRNMERIKLQTCKNMQDYLNQISMALVDIKDAGGTYHDDQLKCKVINNLHPRFNHCINELFNSPTGSALEAATWDNVKAWLLHIQHTVHDLSIEHLSLKTESLSNNENETAKNIKPEHQGRSQCGYPPCQKWGHTEGECRNKKRDLESEKVGDQEPSDREQNRKHLTGPAYDLNLNKLHEGMTL